MKQRYSLRSNAVKFRAMALVLIALVMGGNVVWGQSVWNPTQSGFSNYDTFYLRTINPGSTNFEVSTTGEEGSYSGSFSSIGTGITVPAGKHYVIHFRNDTTILMNGQFYLNYDNSSVTLILDAECNAHSATNPTLRIKGVTGYQNGQQNVFFIRHPNNYSNPENRKISIQGIDPSTPDNVPSSFDFSKNFVIDGDGPSLTLDNSDPWNPKVSVGSTGTIATWGIFRFQQGTLQLKNVTVQNLYTERDNAGVIHVMNSASNVAMQVDVNHCLFKNIVAKGSPVIRLQQQTGYSNTVDNRNVSIKKSQITDAYTIKESLQLNHTYNIKDCTNSEGIIRSFGNNVTKLQLKKCHITKSFGCPVRWHGCGTFGPATIDSCIIENNYTKTAVNVRGGGGLLLKGPANITNCTIRNNKTDGDGGGIYLSTYTDFNDGTIGFVPDHSILHLDEKTLIEGNEAKGNGGGIAMEAIRMQSKYNNGNFAPLDPPNGPNGYIWYVNDGTPFTVKFQLGGAKILNNIAYGDYGGGVYIIRNREVTYFKLECDLDKGEIKDNKVLEFSTGAPKGHGGGVAIYAPNQPENPNVMPNTVEPQDVTVIIGKSGETSPLTIQSDTADMGGGIYVEAYAITYNGVTSDVNTSVNDNAVVQKNSATSDGGGIYVQEGSVSITGATIGGDVKANGNTAGGSGGGLYLNQGTITMLSSKVNYNSALSGSGGGIFLDRGDVLINHNESETTNPTQIDHNVAQLNGGGLSNNNGQVVIFGSFNGDNTYRVNITNNEATTGSGGGIFCIGDTLSSEYDIRMRRVLIHGNKTKNGGGTQSYNKVVSGCGGGIYLQDGKISIINGIIDQDTAYLSGGGIYTQHGDIDINPTREERQASQITNNCAGINGGGLNTHSGKITVLGKDKNNRIFITGNTAKAGSGGGMFCMGGSDNTEYITVLHADLKNNQAQNGGGEAGDNVTPGCGGGMYLQRGIITVTDVSIQGNYAKYNGGGINNHSGSIDVNGCVIGGSSYYNGTDGQGNKAGHSGGGIYTNFGDIDIEDYVETEGGINRYESKITYNEAVENGGGINTHQGTITINGKELDDQIEVSYNKANKGGGMYAHAGTIKAYNALIHDNTATTNGGGINNHSGDIFLYGGMLSNNLAEQGHGGGAYTNVGDIDLFQFPSDKLTDVTLNDGTKIYNNIALKNGGAFNNHTGRVDVRHATLYNNTATQGNGGAIFCEGPHANTDKGLGFTIRLLCSDMVQNKTRGQDGTETEPTGRGGGIYLKYGSIYAHYSNILNNEANIAGGGVNNHEGNILLYGCDIIGNKAIELDGGGIFAKKGNITTGPSAVREATSSTPSKATVIQKNSAHYDGGGIYNHEGIISLNGDLIGGSTPDLGNTAEKGNGGGVYIADGTITMAGGNISYNKADLGKGGGVYSGGGEFNIQERDSLPTPIVLLVDVKVKRNSDGQNATVHYHLVDQGKYSDVSNVEHGIIWGDNNTMVVYGEETMIDDYVFEQGEPACQRITILNLQPSEAPYKAKAFFRYTYNGQVYTGYSEEMEFVTFSDTNPMVLSGAVSNITKNGASGSGKIMDKGGSDIVQRGVQLWTGVTPTDTTGTLYPSSDQTDFFTVDWTGLTPNTTYYARAYATNDSHIGFGATVEFKTLKATPDMGSHPVIVENTVNDGVITVTASFTMPEGTVFGNGENDVKAFGFVWSTDDDPELHTDHTVPGTLTGNTTTFTASYPNAAEGTCFYVRAYASNVESEVTSSSDVTNYSVTNPVQHFTPNINGAPVVRAIKLSNITQTSATITCKIYSGYNYGGVTTVYGVHLENDNSYHASTNYSATDSTYTVTLTGLNVNTTYYLKAYATNETGDNPTYSYGNGYNFTTLPVALPHVVIESVSDITKTEANINCSLENGGGNVSDWGIKYSLNSNMSSPTNVNQPALSGNTFSGSLTGLTEHTTYYVQAYATNSAGTHTCPMVSFTTEYDKPIVSDLAITNIGFNATAQEGRQDTARANFKVKSFSTQPVDSVKTYGVCWSVLHNPTRKNSDVSDSHFLEITNDHISATEAQSRSILMTQKFPNTKYYVRAYASVNEPDSDGNLADIVYHPLNPNPNEEVSFITMPAIVTGTATNIGKTSATLSGQIASRDSEGYLVNGYYGVCWGTSENPTRVEGYYTEHQITAANANVFNFSLATATDLTANTTYHYRAYYRPVVGNIAYGLDQTFHTREFGVTASVDPESSGTVNIVYNDGANNTYNCTVTATANPGYTFTNWTENNTVVSTNAEYVVTIGSTDRTLVANFTANTYTITVAANPTVGGTVGGGGSVNYGSSVTLTATAADNYEFVNWTLNDEEVSADATYTFNYYFLTDTTFVAHFTQSGGRSNSQTRRSRDIYPAPAREPWDWDDDFFFPTDTLRNGSKEVVNPVNIPQINNNSAEYGGGVYVAKNTDNPAKIVFAGGSTDETAGTINFNIASEAGGGVYISDSASMQMKGHCHVNSNHVPADKKGGGIYLNGILKVGDQPGDAVSAHALQVNGNWAGDSYVYNPEVPNANNRNNVYLPEDPIPLPTADANLDAGNKQRVITLLSDISGTYTIVTDPGEITEYYSKIGLSVDHGYRAVIYTQLNDENNTALTPAREPWLTQLITSGSLNGAIFDDANKYYALHISNPNNPDDLKPQYDYLYGCWTTEVTSDPGTDHINQDGNGVYHIKTNRGLAWFTSIVNGLNGQAADSSAKAVLEADVDMSEHLWVPIGSVKHYTGGTGTSIVFDDSEGAFTGEFNGQGNLITGLKCYFVTGIKRYGLFGTVTSANNHVGKVWNTFVDDYRFHAFRMGEEEQYKYAYRMGGIASELTGSATISASEARGVMNTPAAECDVANTYKGGLVGKMDGTAVIHSSMAMPTMQGQADYVGGLVGQVGENNKLLNSFSNAKYPDASYTMNTGKFIGGLVGENNGIVENCYSRLQSNEPTSDGTKSVFGWLAGTNMKAANENNGGIRFCYIPKGKNVYVKAIQPDGIINQDFGSGTNVGNEAPYGHGKYDSTLRVSGKYGFKHRDHKIYDKDETLIATNYTKYVNSTINDTLVGGLMHALNHWVDTANKETTVYHKWTRTMASPINDDYPVPMLSDFNAVGSEDSIYMHYKHHVDSLISAYTKINPAKHPTPSIYLYDTIKSGDAILPITKSNVNRLHPNVMLAINEDLGITVDGDAATNGLNARVGVTIKNARKGSNDQTDNPNWHLFSSAINEVPIGLVYHTTESNYPGVSEYSVLNAFSSTMQNPPAVGNGNGIQNTDYWNRNYMDPPKTSWSTTNVGYFPTNTPYGTWRSTSDNGFFDLYTYSEEWYHWVNFKREGKTGLFDHWHMDVSEDGTHEVLPYANESEMPNGKGYMMALSSESMMMADGQLNTGEISAPVTLTAVGTHNPRPSYGYDWPWRSLNLVGNPYQSYLDFLKLIANNDNKALLDCDSYATRDDNTHEFIFYTWTQSKNTPELMASQYIHPHQGFFIKVKDSGNLKFTDDMRVAGTNTSLDSDFRDIDYPLVNLICYEPSGHRNFTTVEVNRLNSGGGTKMKNLRTGDASIYAHFEDNDYQTLFTPMGVSTVPVWFETKENGIYTLRWNTLHGDFSYLHLIDHIMGTDIDCLTTDEYKFEANTSDYKSRFKLVFNCVGVEEYEEEDMESATFAFQMGDELVVNGEGILQMFDISGRCLMSTQTVGQQSSVSLPKTAAGLYLLRLTTNSQVKVQKMVIK